ncbi:serine hydrolase [Streptomyces echinatus]|uniref:serine hydrolase n=1 Tax=Streptomyces echinatus TaxID=67293 RepID=UPI003CD0A98A
MTGDSYAHQAAVRIFRPLGMRHSSFPLGARTPGSTGRTTVATTGWTAGWSTWTDWNMTDRFVAAGDLISTTADLERLLVELFPRPGGARAAAAGDVHRARRAGGVVRRGSGALRAGRQGDLGQDRLAAGLRHGDRRDPGPVPDPGLLGRRHGREGRRPGRRPSGFGFPAFNR